MLGFLVYSVLPAGGGESPNVQPSTIRAIWRGGGGGGGGK